MCKGLLEKKGKLSPFVSKHTVNEKNSGHRHSSLSQTTLKIVFLNCI